VTIDEQVSRLTNLRSFTISKNKISLIPVAMAALTELIHFDASHNALVSFPSYFAQTLSKIKVIFRSFYMLSKCSNLMM